MVHIWLPTHSHGKYHLLLRILIAEISYLVQTDEVVFWYRGYPKAISCSTGTEPRNSDFPVDAVFALAMLKDTATVQLTVGENTVSFTAGPGLTLGSVPFSTKDQQTPSVSVSRNGTTVVQGSGGRPINTTACDYCKISPIFPSKILVNLSKLSLQTTSTRLSPLSAPSKYLQTE